MIFQALAGIHVMNGQHGHFITACKIFIDTLLEIRAHLREVVCTKHHVVHAGVTGRIIGSEIQHPDGQSLECIVREANCMEKLAASIEVPLSPVRRYGTIQGHLKEDDYAKGYGADAAMLFRVQLLEI